MTEIGLQELTYVLGSFVTDKLNKAHRKSKKYLESIFIRIEEIEGAPCFLFGFYDEGVFKIIDTAKINNVDKEGIKNKW